MSDMSDLVIVDPGWTFRLGDRTLTKAYVDHDTKTIYFEMDRPDVEILEYLKKTGKLLVGKKLAAIKAVRNHFELSVAQARDAVERIEFDWYTHR